MSDIKITIVTVTFNLLKAGRKETFLRNLQSVHDQTYDNIEHLIIDGASSDGTLELLQEYQSKGWIKFISEPDKGIYDAMNKAIKYASGDYIAFLNSDDSYHQKTGIERVVKVLSSENPDFSYAPARFLLTDGSPLPYYHPQSEPDISKVFQFMPFSHQTMFTKKSVLERENGFDTSFRSAADYDFVLRVCLKKYKSAFVNFCFTTFTVGGFSDSDPQRVFDEVLRSYQKNFLPLAHISDEELRYMYDKELYDIPYDLAVKLKEFAPYFSFEDYEKSVEMRKQGIITDHHQKPSHVKLKVILNKVLPVNSNRRKILSKAYKSIRKIIKKS